MTKLKLIKGSACGKSGCRLTILPTFKKLKKVA